MRSFRESAMKCQRCEDSFKVDVRLFGVTRRGYNTQGNSYLEKGSSRSISSVWKGTKQRLNLRLNAAFFLEIQAAAFRGYHFLDLFLQ